jgi:hypothetical protein
MTLVPVPVNVTPTLNMAEPQNISKRLRMSKNWFLNMFGISALERDTNMIFSWTGWLGAWTDVQRCASSLALHTRCGM